MPIIPVSDSPQVLNPGSPVAAISTDTPRLMGDQVASLGHAVISMGEHFQQAAKIANAEKQRLDVATAFNAYRSQAMQSMMKQAAAAPLDGDPDGTKTIQKFQTDLKDPMDTLAKQIADPATRQQFINHANDFTLDLSQHVYANDIQKKVKANDVKMGQYVSQQSDFARVTGDYENTAKDSEAFIRSSPDLMDAEKESRIAKMRQSVLSSVVDGHLENKNWKGANAALETFGGGVYDEKHMEDMKNRVFNAEWTNTTRSLTAENKYQILEEKQRAKQEKQILSQTILSLQSGDAVAGQQAIDNLWKAVGSEQVDAKKANSILSSKTVRAGFINSLSTTAFKDILAGKDPEDVTASVTSEVGGTLNFQQAGMITMQASALKKRMDTDHTFVGKVQSGEDMINSLTTAESTQGLSPAEQMDRQRTAGRLIGKYYSTLGANAFSKTLNPTETAAAIMRGQGLTPPPAGASIEGLKKQAQDLLDAEQDPISGRAGMNLSTPATRQDTARKIKEIQDQIKQLQHGAK